MPEGPELHLASKFVNLVCRGRIFTGKVVKSEVSTRQVEVNWSKPAYTISAASRGKELKLSLISVDPKTKIHKAKDGDRLDIVFQFGMSGKFDFYEASELKKHAHLNFYTNDKPPMVLSYVDYRRFGSWKPGGDWSRDRGPCVIFEYEEFRQNVTKNISDTAFNKPVCETLLNQKYFNGIGNYLRAEILYRAGIPPFVSARSVIEPLIEVTESEGQGKGSKVKVKQEGLDILQLCNILPLEVVNLGGTGYDPEGRDPNYSKFTEWLQCYYNPHMKNMADHNKRTIWYAGNPGPMVPKEQKTKKMKKTSKVYKNKVEKGDETDEIKTEKKTKKEMSSIKLEGLSQKVTRTKLKMEEIKSDNPSHKVTRDRKKKALEKEDMVGKISPRKTRAKARKSKNTHNEHGDNQQYNEYMLKTSDTEKSVENGNELVKNSRKRRVCKEENMIQGEKSDIKVCENAAEMVKRRKRNTFVVKSVKNVNDGLDDKVETSFNDRVDNANLIKAVTVKRGQKIATPKCLKGSKLQRRNSKAEKSKS